MYQFNLNALCTHPDLEDLHSGGFVDSESTARTSYKQYLTTVTSWLHDLRLIWKVVT